MLVSRLLAVVCAAPRVAACSVGGVSGPAAQAGRPDRGHVSEPDDGPRVLHVARVVQVLLVDDPRSAPRHRMLGPMRSLKHLLLVVGLVPIMTACSLIGLKFSPTGSEPNAQSSGDSASTVPTVSISLSLPSGASSSAQARTAQNSRPH